MRNTPLQLLVTAVATFAAAGFFAWAGPPPEHLATAPEHAEARLRQAMRWGCRDATSYASYRTHTLLGFAVDMDCGNIVRELVAAGADVNAAAKGQCPLLWRAMDGNQWDVARHLLRAGARADARWPPGRRSPLFVAVLYGQTDIAELLIAHGADVNEREDGETLLQFALRVGEPEAARLLVHGGANVNARDDEGRTPLDTARANGYDRIARLLTERGATASDSPGGSDRGE